MGILNLTPDSFSDGGRYDHSDVALARVEELIAQGADLIDVGAESTRPGAELLTAEAEWERLRGLMTALSRRQVPAVLSIDTRHLAIAERAAAAGICLLNLTFPQHLLSPVQSAAARALDGLASPGPGLAPADLAAVLGAFDGLVVMHSRGTPAMMRQLTDYGPDLCHTVIRELTDLVSALTDPRLRARVLFDPGLGFAKTPAQSLQLLGQLERLRAALGGPILVGASRKSMLGSVTGLPVHERLVPSVVAAVLAAQQGAAIVRVHDVAATRLALQLERAVRDAAAPRLAAGGGP
jgi:dihydropteroate synthase